MSRNKSEIKKQRLGKFLKQKRSRVPAFVIAKTNRRVMYNIKARSWRNRKIKLREG